MIFVRNSTLVKAWSSIEADKIAITLAATCALPILMHFIPWSFAIPIGAVWLPAFYAPLLAILFFRPHVSWTAALLGPGVNFLLTGKPAPPMVGSLTMELVFFSVVLSGVYSRRFESRWFPVWTVLVLIAAKIFSGGILMMTAGLFGRDVNFSRILTSIIVAMPGIMVLALLGWGLMKIRKEAGA